MQKLYMILILAFIGIQDTKTQAIQGKLLGTWQDSTLVGSSVFNNAYNEIWGVVANGSEYAIIGSTRGTHFIDVSDPTSPINVVTIDGGTTGAQIIHRDYHDMNGYLYAVADEGGQSTLQIMDLSFLPDSVPVVYDSKELIRLSHNIFIDTSSAILYSCSTIGDNAFDIALRLFDISNPIQPEIIDAYSIISNVPFASVHDTYVRNDTAYLNLGTDGLFIADFSDPLAPQGLANLGPTDYLQSGYNHSGWLSDDGRTYYLADETWSQDVKVIDVSALPDVAVIDTIDGGSDHFLSIPHNLVAHGDFLYGAYYYDGLQVWNIKDPNNIRRVLHYPTSTRPHRQDYEGAWGVYPFLPSGHILVSDMQNGLFVVENVENTVSTSRLEDELSRAWSISPNPSDGYFEINIDEALTDFKLELLTVTGEKLCNLERVNQKNLANGLYVVQLTSENVQSTKT